MKPDPNPQNRLGNLSLAIGMTGAVVTSAAWSIFFPFTLQGIRILILFAFGAAIVSSLLGLVALFRTPRITAACGIATSVLLVWALIMNVG